MTSDLGSNIATEIFYIHLFSGKIKKRPRMANFESQVDTRVFKSCIRVLMVKREIGLPGQFFPTEFAFVFFICVNLLMGPKITWENIKYGLQNYNENLAYKKLKFN